MRLHVRVELDGVIIDDTVVAATHGARLGEHDDAIVAFPGADLVVHREPEGVRIRGQRIREGETLRLTLGAVRVTLTPTAPPRPAFAPRLPVDAAMPILVASIVLVMLASQNVRQVLHDKADVSAGVARRVEALLLPPDLRRLDPPPRTIIFADDGPWTAPVRFVEQPEPEAGWDRAHPSAR